MSQNQEIIEAKLCSYIDGELDPEGKAEIERHLQANPQHRRLLESLKATRDLLRWLPREPSPPELAETLNGQLERSVLLDYDGDSLRPSFLPRVLAAAAIIILTAGLAAAVYFALPKNHTTLFAKAHQQEEGKTQAPAPAGAVEAERDSALAKGGVMEKPSAGEVNSLDQVRDNEDLKKVAEQAAQNPTLFMAAANGATSATPDQTNTAVVMLVRSDSPDSTQKQLAGYLTSNQIQWRSALAQQGQQPQRVGEDRMFAMKSAAGEPAETMRQEANTQGGLGGGGTTGTNLAVGRASGGKATPAPTGLQEAQTQPAQQAEGSPQASAQSPENQQTAPQAQSNPQQVLPQIGGNANWAANAYRGNTLYAARMSRSQARQLQSTIVREGATVEMRDLASVESVTDAANLSISQEELKVNGLGQRLAPTTLPSTNPATVQEGALRSRMVEAGRAIEGLDRRGIDAKNGPATREDRAKEERLAKDGSRSSDRMELDAGASGAQALAATEPGAPTTSPASDEPVNVVILVEPNNEPSTVPTTQPAVKPPATQPATSP